ncbi:hypothetical protein Bca4012_002384 [Brassica carinata]|uniref:Uncharacterized protein n=1 Tax=Brassica carinata TaxID=52824 RepID=A0A8X7V1C5_BRACI|nr:hypothetical protein Bca52824_042850 [Brassica carinata]
MFIIVLNTVVLRFIFIRIMLLELCFSSLQNGLNDILEKGTAFRVSENEGLLETMNHLTLKLRDEVKKLLNSKHLFFKEKRYMLITTAAAISTNCVRLRVNIVWSSRTVLRGESGNWRDSQRVRKRKSQKWRRVRSQRLRRRARSRGEWKEYRQR